MKEERVMPVGYRFNVVLADLLSAESTSTDVAKVQYVEYAVVVVAATRKGWSPGVYIDKALTTAQQEYEDATSSLDRDYARQALLFYGRMRMIHQYLATV